MRRRRLQRGPLEIKRTGFALMALAVLVVLLHPRTVFAVIVALPLSVAASFAGLWMARELFGWSVDVNIMSLAGLAISVGVLVDSSMVLVENSMVRLREKWNDTPVRGDTREVVSQACRTMGSSSTGSGRA